MLKSKKELVKLFKLRKEYIYTLLYL